MGELTSEVSASRSQSEQVQIGGTITASATVAKSEVASKYQTMNSQSIETKRKANVQSQFREFRSYADKHLLIRPGTDVPSLQLSESEDIINDPKICVSPTAIKRGAMVEVNVELEADPVFKISTMMSEVIDMSRDYPGIFGSEQLPLDSSQTAKMFEKLLAGLIPIRGRCVDHVVCRFDDDEYIVHKRVADTLGINSRPLIVVGVTEHLGYWKDIRRVLFSKSEFTVICRVGRNGLHLDWSPVKLADIFRDVVPNLANHLSGASVLSDSILTGNTSERSNDRFMQTTRLFANKLIADYKISLDGVLQEKLDMVIENCRLMQGDLREQRSSFDQVLEVLGISLESVDYLNRRRDARSVAGLGLFGDSSEVDSEVAPKSAQGVQPLFLDCEFIAIYW